ncbi:MAG: TonB-dependent receptor, partial [Bacteroidales bacterium]|nr:TonB-dependent receptor [Bacteroidales bacterium]
MADYTLQQTGSSFGFNSYDASQHSIFANLIYRNAFSDEHELMAGVNATVDLLQEDVRGGGQILSGVRNRPVQIAPYAEYTYRYEERLAVVAGLSGTTIPGYGFYPVPRLTVRYQPFEPLVVRFNGGRGLRLANPVADNIGILSTGKRLVGDLTERVLEDAWTFGGNATLYFGETAYLSLDYFHTRFNSALLTDREAPDAISLYSLDGHRAWSDNFQADFNVELFDRLTLTLTG